MAPRETTGTILGIFAAIGLFAATSTAHAALWDTVDEWAAQSPVTTDMVVCMRLDSSGRHYASFIGDNLWVLRVREFGADSWREIDRFNPGPSLFANAYGIAFTQDGQIVVTGEGDVGKAGDTHWLARKGSASGGFRTVDQWQLAPGHESKSERALEVGNALFATGFGIDSEGVSHWIVRRSLDGGETWATVDDFQDVSGMTARADSVVAGSDGIFVSGTASEGDGKSSWFIRKSSDGGQHWETIDRYRAPGDLSTETGWGGFAEADGTIAFGGAVDLDATSSDTLIRVSHDNGAT